MFEKINKVLENKYTLILVRIRVVKGSIYPQHILDNGEEFQTISRDNETDENVSVKRIIHSEQFQFVYVQRNIQT